MSNVELLLFGPIENTRPIGRAIIDAVSAANTALHFHYSQGRIELFGTVLEGWVQHSFAVGNSEALLKYNFQLTVLVLVEAECKRPVLGDFGVGNFRKGVDV